jgi:uncharacterized integral membrane protein
MINEQKQPSIFLYIGEFDMTFPSTSPEAYIDRLQDQSRLPDKTFQHSRRLKLLPTSNNNDVPDFALQHNIRGFNVWAIGAINTYHNDEIRVYGKVGLDYGLLVITLVSFLFGCIMILTVLGSEQFVEKLFFIVAGYIIAFSVTFLKLFSLKNELIDYLQETNTPTQI